jgi:hypothetical protein
MRKIFFYAFAVGITLCNVSCGSDDASNDSSLKAGNTIKGKYEAEAATYIMNQSDAPIAEIPTQTDMKQKAVLEELTCTEYGQAVIGINVYEEDAYQSNGTLKYATYEMDLKGNVFSLSDKRGQLIGTIKKEDFHTSRGTTNVTLTFDLTVSIEIAGVMVPLKFASISQAQEVIETAIEKYTANVTNTWKIERMKLTIDFDTKTDVSTESYGGSLKPFLELAQDNDVKISEKDMEQLNRTIENLIIDKNKLFVLRYADGRSDAASWQWVNQTDGNLSIAINLKAIEEGGNKFLNNNSKIAVELKANNKINLIISTRLEDDKCTASLLINLY